MWEDFRHTQTLFGGAAGNVLPYLGAASWLPRCYVSHAVGFFPDKANRWDDHAATGPFG